MAAARGEATSKVGLVGVGMVGASFAYALMQNGTAIELVLVDADQARAEGEAMDLNHGMAFVRPMRIYAGDYADLADAAVVVIAAGANQKPGESRLDLLQRNASIIRAVVPQVLAAAPGAILLIATNPVDLLTQIASSSAGLAHGQVFGSGTILDTARFRYLLGAHYNVDPRSVHAYIVGEHGDTELALWSLANIGGVRLHDFRSADGRDYDQAALDEIFVRTRDAAYAIIQRKKATYYAIGLSLLTIVEAILRDQRTVLTVSTPVQGYYGVSNIALSLPTIVGRRGAEEVLNLALSPQETAAFQHSATVLTERLQQLDHP